MADTDILERVKTLLGDSLENYGEDALILAVGLASSEVSTYCRRELDEALEYAVAEIAVIKLNRLGTEGAAALSYSGVSESYLDGYPAHIQALLNTKRKLKVL